MGGHNAGWGLAAYRRWGYYIARESDALLNAVRSASTTGMMKLRVSRMRAYFELLFTLAWTDVRVLYKQSVLGPAWALFLPLILMFIFVLVRSFVGIKSDGMPYPIFVYSAVLPWTLFASSITYATPKIVQSRALIRKIYFPREVLPIAAVLRALVDFSLAFLVFIGMMIYYQIVPGVAILLLPALLVIQLTLAIGVGCITSAVGAYRRDIVAAVPVLTQVWMFMCPVIYPFSSVPEKYQTLYLLNPMASLIEAWRQILVVGEVPEARLMVSAMVGAVVV